MSSPTIRLGIATRGARLSAQFRQRLLSPGGEAEAPPSPVAIALLAGWFGLIAGLIELLAIGLRDVIDPRVTAEVLHTNRHWPWMVPVANLAIFAAVGPTLAVLAAVRPRWGTRAAFHVYVALATLPLLFAVRGLYTPAYLLLAVGVSAKVAPPLASRAGRVARIARRTGPVMAVGLAIFGGLAFRHVDRAEARALATLPPAPRGAPNLLLVVLDTVRADALSLYGYGRDTSPRLAEFASGGVRFDRARSTAPWTLPAHASMFTGRWPHELSASVDTALDDAYPTLAETLAGHGYMTGGFVANTHFCNARFGLDRGFARYEDRPEDRRIDGYEVLRSAGLGRRIADAFAQAGYPLAGGSPAKDAEILNRDALEWIEGAAATGRPFFAFLNYFDAHHPYIVPAGDHRRLGLRPETPADFEVLRHFFDAAKIGYSQREFDLARDGYDDCIAYLDTQLGRLFDDLGSRGILENTVVIVTADHGESWGEHQLYGHGRSLYHSEIHVPLIVAGPGAIPAGRVIDEPASLRDLPATALDLLGLGGPGPFPGRSLARYWDGGPVEVGPILSEVSIVEDAVAKGRVPAMRGPITSLLDDRLLYIRNASGREELYDTVDDPLEARDLVADPASRETLKRLRDRLKALMRD